MTLVIQDKILYEMTNGIGKTEKKPKTTKKVSINRIHPDPIMPIKNLTKTEERVHIGFRLDPPVYEALLRLASREERTLSAFLRKVLTSFVATSL